MKLPMLTTRTYICGRSARKDSSMILPANERSSLRLSTATTMVLKPSPKNSSIRALVSLFQSGKSPFIPTSSNLDSRYAFFRSSRNIFRKGQIDCRHRLMVSKFSPSTRRRSPYRSMVVIPRCLQVLVVL